MLRLSKSLLNQPVISLRLGRPVAIATEPIINPHNLKIVGWWCKSPGGKTKPQVLVAEDVRELTLQGILINDEGDLIFADELVRYKDVLAIHFQLLDKVVKTKRRKLGKISDFAYEDKGLFIQKLYVARALHKIFSSEDTLIIDRSQIIEVTDHYVLVRDSEITVNEEELAASIEAVPAS
ncbi:hypothetical protein HYW35_01960 [Candidatus Saccharibacteria bacterium]|nr:hypothetical protein [Candidatus Saccharibacteria bacterium]